jgi:outer membrane protein assembly factor BamB
MRRVRVLGLIAFLPALAVAADWPGWLGPNRDGSTPDKIQPWKEPLKAVWRFKVGEGHSSPIIVGGKVYLHTKVAGKDEEQLTAYALADGKELWSKTYPRGNFKAPFGNGPRGTPLFEDGKIYTLGISGYLTCWDADKGEQLWQVDTLKTFQGKNLTFGISASPLIVGDKVLLNVGAPGASLVAFNKKTGEVLWKDGDAKASYASPIAYGKGNDREALFFTAKGLQAVNPADGKTRWSFPLVDLANESSTTPIKVGDYFLASSITSGMVGLIREEKESKVEVKQVWKNSLSCYFSTPVAVGDHVYLVTGNILAIPPQSTLHCIDYKTGKVQWSKEKVGKYHAALVRTGNDKLLMLDDFGNVSLLDPDPKEFKELAQTKVCGQTWVTPAVSAGKVVLRDEKELICLDVPQ